MPGGIRRTFIHVGRCTVAIPGECVPQTASYCCGRGDVTQGISEELQMHLQDEKLGLKTGCPSRVQNGIKEKCDGLCNLPYQYKDTGWFI